MAKVNTYYVHFKGGVYKTGEEINICLPDAPDMIPGILYRNVKTRVLYCRAQSDFDYEGPLSNGTTGKRFSDLIEILRGRTGGATVWECEEALVETEYDIEQAVRYLKGEIKSCAIRFPGRSKI